MHEEIDPARGNDTVIEYYRHTELDYLVTGFWRRGALHYGWWDETTRNLGDALSHENEVLASIADIQPGEAVLDAGCGIGGSSLYIAGLGANVTGITVSPRQVEIANRKARRASLSDRARFEQRDYTNTGYQSESFDVVWALESVGHTPDKDDFIREARRLLKPGGRLVMTDGWATSPEANDNPALKKMVAGWGSPGVALDTLDRFTTSLDQHGFVDIQASDETPHVIPTIEHLYKWYRGTRVIHSVLRRARLRNDVQALNHGTAKDQYEAWRDGAWHYGLVFAKKGVDLAA